MLTRSTRHTVGSAFTVSVINKCVALIIDSNIHPKVYGGAR